MNKAQAAPVRRESIDNMQFLDETPLIIRLPRSVIKPDPNQVRKKERNQEKLAGIALTMRERQLQPIIVVETTDGYQIVVGEGRWLAAGINEEELGTEQYLDCVVIEETSVPKIRCMQIVENTMREDMDQLDIAESFQALIDEGFCADGKAVAAKTGFSEATVSVYLAVLNKASDEVKELVKTGKAKMDAARQVTKLAEIAPEKAAELIQGAQATGLLKRSDTSEALKKAQEAEKKDRPPKIKKEKSEQQTPPVQPELTVATPQDDSGTHPGPVIAGRPLVLEISVTIKDDSPDSDVFIKKMDIGNPKISINYVSAKPGYCFVQFGDNIDDIHEFSCGDIVISSILSI